VCSYFIYANICNNSQVRDVRLFDRETIFREQVVAELASEGSYWHNELLNKQRLYRKKNFEQLDAELLAEEEILNAEIKQLEANYVEMMRQRRQISPRGLEQGWREELDENTANHRIMITEKKLHLNFDLMLRHRSNHEKMTLMKEQLSVARFTSDKFNDWREGEVWFSHHHHQYFEKYSHICKTDIHTMANLDCTIRALILYIYYANIDCKWSRARKPSQA
jgi:hypothetical protein